MSFAGLVALSVALSSQHGVRVEVGGNIASTERTSEGYVIRLPAIPDADEEYFTAIRGYIDHECGHVRFSNYKELPSTNRDLMTIINAVEDVFVERGMSAAFEGCALNLRRLVLKLFNKPVTVDNAWARIAYYVILSLRSLDVEELKVHCNSLRQWIDARLPGLTSQLDPLFKVGKSTKENVQIAKTIWEAITQYLRSPTGRNTKSWATETYRWTTAKFKRHVLERMRTAPKVYGDVVEAFPKMPPRRGLARMVTDGYKPMIIDPISREEGLSVSLALRARLEGLLQARDMERSWVSRSGRVDTRRLARVAVGDGRVFLRNNLVKRLNTEIIILCDASGSMGSIVHKVDGISYALMTSLNTLKGVDSSLYHFSSEYIKKIKDRVRMGINPEGGTLLASAMLYCMQQFSPKRDRKILLALTDGCTSDTEFMPVIADTAKALHVEPILIGLGPNANVEYSMPHMHIMAISELPTALFDTLKELLYG